MSWRSLFAAAPFRTKRHHFSSSTGPAVTTLTMFLGSNRSTVAMYWLDVSTDLNNRFSISDSAAAVVIKMDEPAVVLGDFIGFVEG